MKYAIIVLALVGVLATPQLAAADITGNALYPWCKKDRNYCVVYVEGWVNGVTAKSIARRQKDLFSHPTMKICMPSKFTTQQSADIFMNYLRDHPEMRDKTTGILACLAFRKAFPCD